MVSEFVKYTHCRYKELKRDDRSLLLALENRLPVSRTVHDVDMCMR